MARLSCILGASALALTPSWALAQVTPPPSDPVSVLPVPTSTSTPVPTETPAPTPTPSPTVTPTPTPIPTATRRADPPAVRRAEQRAPSTPIRTPTPATTPAAEPLPAPAPVSTATPAPIETVVVPPRDRAAPLWPWLAGAAALPLTAALLLLRRRREPVGGDDNTTEQRSAVPPPPPMQRARLAIAVRPTRAGLNLLTATVEGEVTLTNSGDAPAHDIRAAVGLLSAHAGADGDLVDLAAQPIGRPATPPFTLQPGEERRFRVVAALPHDAIRPMIAAGRPMFVPLIAVTVLYRDDAAERQVAQAFAVGVERVDSAKLAPLWLDVPPRAFDNVAARPHAGAIER